MQWAIRIHKKTAKISHRVGKILLSQWFPLRHNFHIISIAYNPDFLSWFSPRQVKISLFVWNGQTLEKKDHGNDTFPIPLFLSGIIFQSSLFLRFVWISLLRYMGYCQLWLQLLNGINMVLKLTIISTDHKTSKMDIFVSFKARAYAK